MKQASARSTGPPTGRRRSCAGSARPRATPACSTRSTAPSSTSSARTARVACAAAPATSSPAATARSAARPSTAPSGSRHLKRAGEARLQAAGRRARWRWPGARPTCPRCRSPIDAPLPPGHTYREIAYEERGGVGYLHFDFYNGAMSTEQCRRLREAYRYARGRRPTKVHRADGRHRLLLQRHPPQRDRGGGRPGRGVLVQPPRDRRRRARGPRDRLAPRDLGAVRATPPPAASRSRSPPTTSSRARTSCSTRTTSTWAGCTGRSTGPTCCRAASATRSRRG